MLILGFAVKHKLFGKENFSGQWATPSRPGPCPRGGKLLLHLWRAAGAGPALPIPAEGTHTDTGSSRLCWEMLKEAVLPPLHVCKY